MSRREALDLIGNVRAKLFFLCGAVPSLGDNWSEKTAHGLFRVLDDIDDELGVAVDALESSSAGGRQP